LLDIEIGLFQEGALWYKPHAFNGVSSWLFR
jgi:hypothetical protein